MRKAVIATLLVLLPALVSAQYAHPSFRPVQGLWTLSRVKIGALTRIKAPQQNPYPFCFSTAAVNLYDQQQCNLNKTHCSTQTSFLAVTPAGQKLAQELEPRLGGSPYLSLQYLLDTGRVDYHQCNYAVLEQNEQQWPQFIYAASQLNLQKGNWQKYQKRTPYLERYFRRQYTQQAKLLNPQITQLQVLELLQNSYSEKQLMHKLLFQSSCFNTKPAQNYEIKQVVVADQKNIKLAHTTIQNLLQENKPVLVNICTHQQYPKPCAADKQHSVVIAAKSTAKHQITRDTRTVYWIINSWGEKWQQDYADGWVFGDSLLESIIGEIIWLEFKPAKSE